MPSECDDVRKLNESEKAAFANEIAMLARKLANVGYKSYRGHGQFSSEIRDEMISAANLGVAKAADKFDPGCGIKPITFAYKFIWFEILSAMRDLSACGMTPNNKSKSYTRPLVHSFDAKIGNGNRVNIDDSSCGENGIEWALNMIDDEREKLVVKLRCVDNLSFREIGLAIGASKGVANNVFRNTLDRIRGAVIEELNHGRSASCRRKIAEQVSQQENDGW